MVRRRNRGGRPSKFTTSAALTLVTRLSEGDSVEGAARAAGVGPSTVYRWGALGRSGDPRFGALAEAVRRARHAASECRAFGELARVLLRRGF